MGLGVCRQCYSWERGSNSSESPGHVSPAFRAFLLELSLAPMVAEGPAGDVARGLLVPAIKAFGAVMCKEYIEVAEDVWVAHSLDIFKICHLVRLNPHRTIPSPFAFAASLAAILWDNKCTTARLSILLLHVVKYPSQRSTASCC